MQLRRSGIRPHVDHVDPGGDERRQNQTVSGLGGVSEAAAAGVPAGVMQLVPKVRHRQPVDHLTGQRSKVTAGLKVISSFGFRMQRWLYLTVVSRLRVDVDCCQVIWFEELSVSVDTRKVDNLLPGTYNHTTPQLCLCVCVCVCVCVCLYACVWVSVCVSPFMASSGLRYPGPHPEQLAEKTQQHLKDMIRGHRGHRGHSLISAGRRPIRRRISSFSFTAFTSAFIYQTITQQEV